MHASCDLYVYTFNDTQINLSEIRVLPSGARMRTTQSQYMWLCMADLSVTWVTKLQLGSANIQRDNSISFIHLYEVKLNLYLQKCGPRPSIKVHLYIADIILMNAWSLIYVCMHDHQRMIFIRYQARWLSWDMTCNQSKVPVLIIKTSSDSKGLYIYCGPDLS